MFSHIRTRMTSLTTLFLLALPVICLAAEEAAKEPPKPALFATWWALLPPIVAIFLALITKEVYSSLLIGITAGGVLYSGGSFVGTVEHVFQKGFLAVLSDTYNIGILIFLVLLGAIVALMNKAGGSAAFGRWSATHIKSKVGAQLATILLGCIIFIDDYFNCLTVGSVMRPVTDNYKISRAKLAYLIDSTAAPICIIAPISSWAAAVSGFVEGTDGLALFIQAIPYNFYAIFTIIMMVILTVTKTEFGPMARYEAEAEENGVCDGLNVIEEDTESNSDAKGGVLDLVIPIICLIVCCVIGMIYTGGFFEGKSFGEAFANCDASVGLSMGSFFGFLATIFVYLIRQVLNLDECMACLSQGFKAMVPAILILSMAWSLKAMTDSLGAKEFVAASMEAVAGDLTRFLPAIIFLVGCFLAFSTGTSWGTFGILIPIVVAVFQKTDPTLMIISISACMAGAVCGDHCSPISDTTIMASAGAQCVHVNHVSTQLPYAVFVASISFVTYIVAGFVQNALVCLAVGAALLVGGMTLMRTLLPKK